MNLMSVTTSYPKLYKKYSGFSAPTIEIMVGTTRLVAGKGMQITSLEIELTSGYEASGASFMVAGSYNEKKTNFEPEIEKLQIGEKIEIAIGYIRTEKVFTGYINQIDYSYGAGPEVASVRVECMDAKGLLMKNRRLEFFNKKAPGALVREILTEKPVSDYLDGLEITSGPEADIALRTNMQTDYEIIVEQADKLGFEFFILQGRAYFRDKQKVTSPVMELSTQKGLFHARLSVSGQSLVGGVEVRAIDENSGKLITGKATISGKFSKGSSASKMYSGSKQIFYEAGVSDNNEATKRASARIEAMAERFGQIECDCIGIPELGPGRFVEVRSLPKVMNQKYYVTYVRHNIDETGFHTIFRGGLKSL